MIPPRTTREFLDLHRDDILRRWKEHWQSIQRGRPESAFPDPPYELIYDALPYDPTTSPPLAPDMQRWFEDSPVFCSGAAFCQLHVACAGTLVRQQYPDRTAILKEIENSFEAIVLDAGTRRWVANLLHDPSKHATVHNERLAVIGQLAAGVAHEVGNPLTAISSIVQLLQRRTTDAFFTEQLGHVKKSIDRIARIVRELVDFSRPAPSIPSPVSVNDILRTAVNLITYDRRARNIRFDSVYDAEVPPVNIVQDQLLQVLLNLLINAVDAMDGEGMIRTTTACDDGMVRISIEDTGHGIAAELLPRIFDPFFTTKALGKGTGLGLSVSYGIIKRYNGSIDVTSRDGHGSTFTVVLPPLAADAHEGADAASISSQTIS
jgi:signal transduction histidine kinase